MNNENSDTPLSKKILTVFEFFYLQAIVILITSVFLVIWLAAQWGVAQAINWFELTAILDQLVLTTFQTIFAVTTLIPVIVYFYVDTRLIIIRAQKKINLEKNQAELIEGREVS